MNSLKNIKTSLSQLQMEPPKFTVNGMLSWRASAVYATTFELAKKKRYECLHEDDDQSLLPAPTSSSSPTVYSYKRIRDDQSPSYPGSYSSRDRSNRDRSPQRDYSPPPPPRNHDDYSRQRLPPGRDDRMDSGESPSKIANQTPPQTRDINRENRSPPRERQNRSPPRTRSPPRDDRVPVGDNRNTRDTSRDNRSPPRENRSPRDDRVAGAMPPRNRGPNRNDYRDTRSPPRVVQDNRSPRDERSYPPRRPPPNDTRSSERNEGPPRSNRDYNRPPPSRDERPPRDNNRSPPHLPEDESRENKARTPPGSDSRYPPRSSQISPGDRGNRSPSGRGGPGRPPSRDFRDNSPQSQKGDSDHPKDRRTVEFNRSSPPREKRVSPTRDERPIRDSRDNRSPPRDGPTTSTREDRAPPRSVGGEDRAPRDGPPREDRRWEDRAPREAPREDRVPRDRDDRAPRDAPRDERRGKLDEFKDNNRSPPRGEDRGGAAPPREDRITRNHRPEDRPPRDRNYDRDEYRDRANRDNRPRSDFYPNDPSRRNQPNQEFRGGRDKQRPHRGDAMSIDNPNSRDIYRDNTRDNRTSSPSRPDSNRGRDGSPRSSLSDPQHKSPQNENVDMKDVQSTRTQRESTRSPREEGQILSKSENTRIQEYESESNEQRNKVRSDKRGLPEEYKTADPAVKLYKTEKSPTIDTEKYKTSNVGSQRSTQVKDSPMKANAIPIKSELESSTTNQKVKTEHDTALSLLPAPPAEQRIKQEAILEPPKASGTKAKLVTPKVEPQVAPPFEEIKPPPGAQNKQNRNSQANKQGQGPKDANRRKSNGGKFKGKR